MDQIRFLVDSCQSDEFAVFSVYANPGFPVFPVCEIRFNHAPMQKSHGFRIVKRGRGQLLEHMIRFNQMMRPRISIGGRDQRVERQRIGDVKVTGSCAPKRCHVSTATEPLSDIVGEAASIEPTPAVDLQGEIRWVPRRQLQFVDFDFSWFSRNRFPLSG